MNCSCSTKDATPAQAGGGEPQGAYSYGTVVDDLAGLAGTVISVSKDKLVVRSGGPLGEVTAELEPAFDGLFDGIKEKERVFCAIRVMQKSGERAIKGVCFWVLDFGTYQKELSAFFDSGKPAAEVGAGLAAIQAAMRVHLDGLLPPVCIIAAVKASMSPGFLNKSRELIQQGYFPVGFECVPGLVGSQTGFVNVVFRFKNIVGHERTIVVPVNLSTWRAAAVKAAVNYAVAADEVIEVDALRWCSPRCLACRIACRVAQAACVAVCPGSGPLAILCVAGCIEVGEECYRRC